LIPEKLYDSQSNTCQTIDPSATNQSQTSQTNNLSSALLTDLNQTLLISVFIFKKKNFIYV